MVTNMVQIYLQNPKKTNFARKEWGSRDTPEKLGEWYR